MTSLSDEALLVGFASGDQMAEAAFVRRFQHRVFGLAVSVLRDRGAAEDVAQEAFVRAWRHAAVFDARRGEVAAWLLTITRNLAIDALRARGARPVTADLVLEHLAWEGDGPEAQVTARSDLSSVLAVVGGIWAITQEGGRTAGAVATASMVDPSGRTVGRIDVGRDPSTVFVALPGWVRYEAPDGAPVTYRLRFDLGGGHTADMGPFTFSPGRDTWGSTFHFDPLRATAVTMVDASGRVLCHGTLPG